MTMPNPRLLTEIRGLIETARQQVVRAVNSSMVQTYWHIGRLIIEDEQQGEARAAYGKQQLQRLSQELTKEFGKGFDVTNLRNMRRFYEAFPNRETVSPELSWSHYYNHLSRIENPEARAWYQQEAIQEGWSVRALERQTGTLYYERLVTAPRLSGEASNFSGSNQRVAGFTQASIKVSAGYPHRRRCGVNAGKASALLVFNVFFNDGQWGAATGRDKIRSTPEHRFWVCGDKIGKLPPHSA